MAVIRTPLPHSAFTITRNCWARDRRLGYKGRGLLTYLLSHADGYKISQAQIVRDSTDGREAVTTGLLELEAAGYLTRTRQRSAGRFAEDDYALADPFDERDALLPHLPKTGADVAELVRKIRHSRKSDPATGADFSTRETLPIEEQGEKNTPAPTEQGNGDGRHLVVVDDSGLDEVAQQLAAEHYEGTGKLGGSKAFLAVRGIVSDAIKAGHAAEQIRPALTHLRQRGRSVTRATLGPLLADPRLAQPVTRSGYGPRAPIPADADAHRGAF